MEAMWVIGVIGLLLIGVGHIIAWSPDYTYDDKNKREEHNNKVVKSFKIVGSTWFVIWLLPPMLKVWITAVLS